MHVAANIYIYYRCLFLEAKNLAIDMTFMVKHGHYD